MNSLDASGGGSQVCEIDVSGTGHINACACAAEIICGLQHEPDAAKRETDVHLWRMGVLVFFESHAQGSSGFK